MSKRGLPVPYRPDETESNAFAQIHNLRQAKSELAESENRFKLLVESVSDYAIFFLDVRGYIQSWNVGAERIKGYTPEEAIGKHFSIFYRQEDIDRHYPEHELRVATEEGRFEDEGWRIKKDGSRFWANVIITRLIDKEGTLVGFAKVTRDLTKRKMAEEELRLSEERFRLLVSAVKDYAIYMLDTDGLVTTWNEGAERLKGYKSSEVIGKHFSIFYPAEDIQAGKPESELNVASTTGRLEDEGWRIRKDGSRFWANVILTPIKNEKGTLIGFSKVTRNVTDRKLLQEKLRRSNEELEERVKERTTQLEQAVRTRDEFMSIISHELRTPVTSLKLQVQTAERQICKVDPQAFNEKVIKFINGAGRQLNRLSKLIDDMLDVSRISMNRLVLEMEEIDISRLVRETVERFEEEFKSIGSSVSVTCDNSSMILGDRSRLEQVLANLLINAMKYGEGKPISISSYHSDTRAFIAIQDQGIGIAPEDQTRIFERFERAVSSSLISGMGLGLFISRKIIEAHEGDISVKSEHGKGAIFTISLPTVT